MAGLWPAWAGAASLTPDSPHAFAEAQIAGKPIVVFVHAAWCITCRRQQPVLEMLTKEPAFANVLVLVVNYDKDKDTRRALGVADLTLTGVDRAIETAIADLMPAWLIDLTTRF